MQMPLHQILRTILTQTSKEVLQEVSLDHEVGAITEEHLDFSEHPTTVVSTNFKVAGIVTIQIQIILHGECSEVIGVEDEEIIEIYFLIRNTKVVGVNQDIFTLPCWMIHGVV